MKQGTTRGGGAAAIALAAVVAGLVLPLGAASRVKAIRAGRVIMPDGFAMGSDAVYSMFGENTRELGWFVKAGMTPAQALGAATSNGAALLGMEHSLGATAPGHFADLVAVEGDPLTDVNAVITGVRWVMKAGEVVKH
jgi:imidazolonepropionase-like amidohydrolase